MDEATLALTVMSLFILAILLGLLIWGIKSGQFKNVEEAKYQLFRDRDQSSHDDKQPERNKEKGGTT
jgi:nitrogen fixation-related uncharacterized protein